ncbi:hypothetical protein [Atlantibacter sp.]|uniref:hypothetical protein n=1 Tax=Atlantibacter sp. TaxID=1903473 RepID=UPI0028AFC97E|nr:hypothetical protein [Atlantibacter sp.]
MNTDIDQQLANKRIHTRFEQSGVETLTLYRTRDLRTSILSADEIASVFGVHAAYHSAGYDAINSVYQTLLK